MKQNITLMPLHTHNNTAFKGLVELVSYGDCSRSWCTCKKNNVSCTDLGRCGDKYQNTSATLPPSAFNDNDDNNE